MTADDPSVDVVIAVHDPRRPIKRAVASVLEGTRASVRISIVVHNTAAEPIVERLGEMAHDARVRILELHDGVRSPAGPFNAGLDAATAPFTSVMGSDDTLEPGAVDSWLSLAGRTGSGVIIARLRHAGGSSVPTPPTRPGRRSRLDGILDRLSYRSAPLGLVSRSMFGSLRFAEGLPVGEDVSYVTRLWFSDARIAYDQRGPAYLIHSDVEGRTTVTPRPIADELAYIPRLLDDDWFAARPAAARHAVAVKLLRIHLFGAVANRPDATVWDAVERAGLRDAATRILRSADGAERVLSRRDRDLLDAVLDIDVSADVLVAAAIARRRFTHPAALIPRRLRFALHREAPLRMTAASALQLF